MFELTVFKNTFDNKTDAVFHYEDWHDFEQMLLNLSRKKGSKGGTNSSPLISPAVYTVDTTRSNSNVDYWGRWCAVDVDDFDPIGDLGDTLQGLVGSYQFVCYSTASSTPKQPKFRIVFPLTERVGADKIPHFWYALNEKLKGIGDAQTKDLSRMYYVPANYPDAFNFFFSNEGKLLDPNHLMDAHSYSGQERNKSFLDRLPEGMQKQIVEYRKAQASNPTGISWSSYLDCPFFPKILSNEYRSITGTGWYHKMYQIMVATAANAVKSEYPITANEIAELCRQLDNDTGKWYDNRPLTKEADRAIEFVYRSI